MKYWFTNKAALCVEPRPAAGAPCRSTEITPKSETQFFVHESSQRCHLRLYLCPLAFITSFFLYIFDYPVNQFSYVIVSILENRSIRRENPILCFYKYASHPFLLWFCFSLNGSKIVIFLGSATFLFSSSSFDRRDVQFVARRLFEPAATSSSA